MAGNRDVSAFGYESVHFLQQSPAPVWGVNLYFFLYFHRKMAGIVLSKGVGNCVFI